MKKDKLPKFLREYFWDVDFDGLTLEEAPTFILKRVLDKGDIKAWRWAQKNLTSWT